jgi:hypothetical protein
MIKENQFSRDGNILTYQEEYNRKRRTDRFGVTQYLETQRKDVTNDNLDGLPNPVDNLVEFNLPTPPNFDQVEQPNTCMENDEIQNLPLVTSMPRGKFLLQVGILVYINSTQMTF